MKKISLWAKHHVFATRIIIFFIHLLLIVLAFYISENIPFHFSLKKLSLVLFILILSTFNYYRVKQKSYLFKKAIYFITSVCFFLIVCFFSKHNFTTNSFQKSLSAIEITPHHNTSNPTAQQILQSLKYRDKTTLTKYEKRILKKELKKQIGIYTKSTLKHDHISAEQALLIILAIIAALGLLSLLSALACSISCGGANALAILVFIVGLAGICFGLYFLIKIIKHKRKRNQ